MTINKVVQELNDAITFNPTPFGWILAGSIVITFILLSMCESIETRRAKFILFSIQIGIFLFTSYAFSMYMFIQPNRIENWSVKYVQPYLKTLPEIKEKVQNVKIYKVGKKEQSFYAEVTSINEQTKQKHIFRDWMIISEDKSSNPSVSYKHLGPDIGYGYRHGNYLFSVNANKLTYVNGDSNVSIPNENTHHYNPSWGIYVPMIIFLLLSTFAFIFYFPHQERSLEASPSRTHDPLSIRPLPESEPEEMDEKINNNHKKREIRA
jgi:hypothetical protein